MNEAHSTSSMNDKQDESAKSLLIKLFY